MLRTLVVMTALLAVACNKKDDSKPVPRPQGGTCVDGTAADCKQSGMVWTGSKCCAAGPATCTSGTRGECVQQGGRWTGAECCLVAGTCVSGTLAECKLSGMTWTGSQCCAKGAV